LRSASLNGGKRAAPLTGGAGIERSIGSAAKFFKAAWKNRKASVERNRPGRAVHAYCLVKCGIKCGTGGGKLFPE
jgi:hypothetical protein